MSSVVPVVIAGTLLLVVVVAMVTGWALGPDPRRAGKDAKRPTPPPERPDGPRDDHETVATTVGVLPATEPSPFSSGRPRTETDVFTSRVIGKPSRHAAEPWLLPPAPAQSGVAADQASVGGLVVRGASVIGIGHRLARPAVARQDSYRLGTDRAGRHLVVAVSDGVSAAPLSDLGATVACRAAVDAILPVLDQTGSVSGLECQGVFGTAARYMAGAADQRRVHQRELAAVLVVVVIPVHPDEWGNRRAWCGWVGDSGAWLRMGDGWDQLAGDRKDGLDRGQVAAALPQGYREARVTVVDLPPDAVVSVTTDGMGDALARPESAAWFAARWAEPPPLASYLLDVDFDARQSTDDRTAITVWCGT